MRSGIKVKEIGWGSNTESGYIRLTKTNERTMETLNEYHGEYDLDWVIEKINGKEIARHNTKYIETIVWEEGEVP